MVKLGDLCEINPRAPKLTDETLISFVSMSDLSSSKARTISETSRPYHEVKKSYTGFQDQDILIAKITPCWENIKIGIANIKNNFGFGSTEFHVIRASDEVTRRYLLHFLRNTHVNLQGKLRMTGSGGQKRVPAKFFEDLQVPLPSLEEQKRIVSILDKAKSIQEARERQLAALDELAITIFQETISSTDFTYMTLDQICGAKGRYGANVPSQDYKVDLPRYIRITDILSDGSLSKKPKSPSGTFSDWEKYFVNSGDLLFARSGATVGKTYIHRDTSNNYVYAGYLIKYHPDPSIAIPEFVYRYTQTPEYDSWVKRAQKAVAQPNINAKQYGSDLMIPVPDLKIQHELIKKIDSVESEKALVREHLKVSQDIFSFLQSNLFTH